MFAFALWDRYERKLVLCRDRVGKKPLYYGWLGDSFVFASELRALRAHPGFAAQVDRGALSQLLRCGWIAQPRSIYAGIHKLPPASLLLVDASEPGSTPVLRSSWSAREERKSGVEGKSGSVRVNRG